VINKGDDMKLKDISGFEKWWLENNMEDRKFDAFDKVLYKKVWDDAIENMKEKRFACYADEYEYYSEQADEYWRQREREYFKRGGER
jgi:hypothetical protein